MWADSFGESDNVVFYVFCAVSAVIMVVAIGVIVMSCIVKTASPGSSMDFYIAFGGLAIVVTVLLRGVNPEWSNELGIEIACQFYISLLVFGLLWFIGGILIRCCAIYDFYKHKEEKVVSRNEWKPNLWMVLLMLLDGVLVLVWVIVFKLETKQTGNNVYECEADHKSKWEAGLSVLHAMLIVIAAIIVWFAVTVSKRTADITNSIILAVVTYNLLFVAIAATLIFFLYEPEGDIVMTSKYAIIGGLELYVVLFTFILLLFAKIVAARRAARGGP